MCDESPYLPDEIWSLIGGMLPMRDFLNLQRVSRQHANVVSGDMRRRIERERDSVLNQWLLMSLQKEYDEGGFILQLEEMLRVLRFALRLPNYNGGTAEWTSFVEEMRILAGHINWNTSDAPIDLCGEVVAETQNAVQHWGLQLDAAWAPPL